MAACGTLRGKPAGRLAKELKQLQAKPPDGGGLRAADDMRCWLVDLQGAPDTLYAGEAFQLQFTFGDDYPMGAPEVVFVGAVPVHHHVYSNGHICLSLLADDWSPALTVSSLCISILSMLSSATEKQKAPPRDNAAYVKRHKGGPKETKWAFHGKIAMLSRSVALSVPLTWEASPLQTRSAEPDGSAPRP